MSTTIETPFVKNLGYYQSYIQLVDPAASSETEEVYESVVCGIENLATSLSKVDSSTMRLAMYEGRVKFGKITTGRYTTVSDQMVKLAWNADYTKSSIDNEPDGNETVTCAFERMAITALSKLQI